MNVRNYYMYACLHQNHVELISSADLEVMVGNLRKWFQQYAAKIKGTNQFWVQCSIPEVSTPPRPEQTANFLLACRVITPYQSYTA